VQRFQENELALCLGSPELAVFFYASFLSLGLGSSCMCSFVVGLTWSGCDHTRSVGL
jgi:hypothetical protein